VAELYAADIERERLQRVTENLQRLNLDAHLLAMDCAKPDGRLAAATFDRILVDAPCSASGVIRRHPDIKLLRRADDIQSFATQQMAIMRGLWPLLAPGGILLYVTCSILHPENDALIQAFLAETDDARLQTIEADWGVTTATGRQLLPGLLGTDGLFFSRLQKSAD